MWIFKGKSNDRILCKLSKSEILRLFWIVHVAMETTKRHLLPVKQIFHRYILHLPSFSFPCHDLTNNIYSQTAKTVFSHLNFSVNAICYLKAECTSSAFLVHLNSNALQVHFRL